MVIGLFNLVFVGYIVYLIVGKFVFVVGFVGGVFVISINVGFLGVVVVGFFVGWLINWVKKYVWIIGFVVSFLLLIILLFIIVGVMGILMLLIFGGLFGWLN